MISVEGLKVEFGVKPLFTDVSFVVNDRDRIALVGKNGAGKSTMLKILCGLQKPTAGNIAIPNDSTLGYLPQVMKLQDDTTVKEETRKAFANNTKIKLHLEKMQQEMTDRTDYESDSYAELVDKFTQEHERYMMLGGESYEAEIEKTLIGLGFSREDFERPTKEFSGGWRMRIELAKILLQKPDVLLLDEPTNHLDLEMTEWLEDYLIRSGLTLLMVTHDRYFLDRVCTEIIEIDQQKAFSYKGNYSYYLEKRQERIDSFNAELARANNLFRKELDWMRRQPQARATKAKSRIDAFSDLEKKVSQKRQDDSVKLNVKSSYIGSKIFEAKYISKSFGKYKLLDNFYYNFSRYEKMGIIGKNGTGKSTFLKILLGLVKPDSGTIDIGETVVFGYYSQDGLQFDEQMKVIDVVRDIAEEINIGDGKKLSASQFLQHFLFTPETQYNYVYKLSGGEKRRLYLCTVLMKNPNFLVLDEPTNDLDIVTLNVLEEYLLNFKGCVIVVSHDRYFMDKIADHLLVFEGDAKIKDFPGNYTDYREWKNEQEEIKIQQSKPKIAEEKRISTRQRKLSFSEQREFDELEKNIATLEDEKKTIEKGFDEGLIAQNDIVAKSERIAELINIIDEKTMRWLELSEI